LELDRDFDFDVESELDLYRRELDPLSSSSSLLLER
jgi:hypothetical protein